MMLELVLPVTSAIFAGRWGNYSADAFCWYRPTGSAAGLEGKTQKRQRQGICVQRQVA